MYIAGETYGYITPFSLRWDERHSTDNGTSWSLDRVMELTRTAVEPKWPVWLSDAPARKTTPRCEVAAFRDYELLVGKWRGDQRRLDVASVLDGCAVMGILETEGVGQTLVFLTYDASEGRWFTAVLDDTPEAELIVYGGKKGWVELSDEKDVPLTWTIFAPRANLKLTQAGSKVQFQRGDRRAVLERSEDQTP